MLLLLWITWLIFVPDVIAVNTHKTIISRVPAQKMTSRVTSQAVIGWGGSLLAALSVAVFALTLFSLLRRHPAVFLVTMHLQKCKGLVS